MSVRHNAPEEPSRDGPDPFAEEDGDPSDEASRESFPASDPPVGWSGEDVEER